MASEYNLFIYIVLLAILIMVNAFFAMSEIAILSINHNKIKRQAEQGEKSAKTLLKLVEVPAKFLATIQVGVTLSGLLASAVAADKFVSLFGEMLEFVPINQELLEGIILVVITLILAYFTLIFGELVPKRIAMKYSDKISLAVAPPIWIFYKLSKPFVTLLAASTNGVLRLFKIRSEDEEEVVTEEEILMMIDEGEESGIIEEEEKDMINNIFELDDKKVWEVMTHRLDMTALDSESSIEEVINIVVQKGYSRIPVYEKNLDHITGVLYVKDLLLLIRANNDKVWDINQYLRKAIFIPESKCCGELLKEFKRQKVHMAIIVDEYGGTVGLVTLEDLLESIVGNIEDEYDQEEAEIIQLSEGAFIFEGLVTIDEVEKVLGKELFKDYQCETLAGFIISALGKIPTESEKLTTTLGEYTFTVTHVADRRIEKIHVRKN